MAYPGIALVAMVSVGIGLALWYLFSDNTNETPHGSAGPLPPRRDTPSPINSWDIPTETRRRGLKSNSKVKDDCPICTEPMDHSAVTVKCGHVYHMACIKKWRETQGGDQRMVTCPLCRQSI